MLLFDGNCTGAYTILRAFFFRPFFVLKGRLHLYLACKLQNRPRNVDKIASGRYRTLSDKIILSKVFFFNSLNNHLMSRALHF